MPRLRLRQVSLYLIRSQNTGGETSTPGVRSRGEKVHVMSCKSRNWKNYLMRHGHRRIYNIPIKMAERNCQCVDRIFAKDVRHFISILSARSDISRVTNAPTPPPRSPAFSRNFLSARRHNNEAVDNTDSTEKKKV